MLLKYKVGIRRQLICCSEYPTSLSIIQHLIKNDTRETHAVLAKQALPSICFWGDGFGWFLELVENIKIEVIILSFASGTLHAGLFMALLPDRKTS